MLTEKELSDIGCALVTMSEGEERNWKDVAGELLKHIRETEFRNKALYDWFKNKKRKERC
jgi:hypothetical protein